MKSTLSKALAALALGVLGMLAFVGPSHAARFIATIDPAFDFEGSVGNAFPNLGFRGTATFNVPDTCLSGSDGWYSRLGSGVSPVSTSCFISSLPGGHIEMESAFIELYYLNDLDKLTQASATFGSSYAFAFCEFECTPTIVDKIDKVLILNHDLVGINSQIMSSVAADPHGIFTGHMGLTFFTDCTGALAVTACHDPVTIQLTTPGPNGVTQTSNKLVPQVFSINRIPEPTTLSLLLAALGAGVFVQRRRRSVR